MDHAPEPHAPHSHGHEHAHGHDHGHHHHGGSEYYLQQLLTIFICGAFGVVGLLLCLQPVMEEAKDENAAAIRDERGTVLMRQMKDAQGEPVNKIGLLLSKGFHPWVMAGSVLLLGVTVFRGVVLWRSAGANQAHQHHDHHHHDHKPGETCDHPSHAHDHHHHDHDHKPGEKCDHPSHAHHGHDHDHGDHSADDHSHGNIYWRVIILLFPVVIFLMNMPNNTFSVAYQLARVTDNIVDVKDEGESTGVAKDVSFETLATAAYSEDSRKIYAGKTVTLNGQYKQLTNTQFTLFFFKMTCCSADQVPLKATCVVKDENHLLIKSKKVPDPSDPSKKVSVAVKPDNGDKVSVTGRLQFTQDATTQEWLTVIRVDPNGVKRQ